MSATKLKREKKRQLGQFLTPPAMARNMLRDLNFKKTDTVLEPSMGDGSFVIPIIEKFLPLYTGSTRERLEKILANNVFGVELDEQLYFRCINNIRERWGSLPEKHNFKLGDFFRHSTFASNAPGESGFSYIVGNPPFGGSFDPTIEDALDKQYGFRGGEKIKKESYAFFIVKSLDLLSREGKLLFICSDTFLTINTMRGLRKLLMREGEVSVVELDHFSEETKHPMVILDFKKGRSRGKLRLASEEIDEAIIAKTANYSWAITKEWSKYFSGPTLGNFMVATSGMTTGKNEFFIREITNGKIIEPLSFNFFNDQITLKNELARARLGRVSENKRLEIAAQEKAGVTKRNVHIRTRSKPLHIKLPHPDYCFYNKAMSKIIFAPPTHAIFWKDEGDAVLTYKKNGNWYLHGVGGQQYFKREGITWSLIASRMHTRFLPRGYILDSGAPCAFLREGIARDELYFIIGWTLTTLANRILKNVINHTKNIQGKDFERLPYPYWVPSGKKYEAITLIQRLIDRGINEGEMFDYDSQEIQVLERIYEYVESSSDTEVASLASVHQIKHRPTQEKLPFKVSLVR